LGWNKFLIKIACGKPQVFCLFSEIDNGKKIF